jgi:glyoxylate/hydroxypyruvate reductase A
LNILIYWDGVDSTLWQNIMGETLPDARFHVYPDIGDPARIDYAVVWMPPDGLLSSLPNLKGIFSIGAGASHILKDPGLPRNVPIVRLVDAVSVRDMCHYAIYWVLHFHRDFGIYRQDQDRRHWQRRIVRRPEERGVGILGLGAIGMQIAAAVAGLGFRVTGWSRSPKDVPGIACESGIDGLGRVLGAAEILINMLPATSRTANLLNAEAFARMPEGAAIINMGRGDAIEDRALIAALDSGRLAGATLDVFRTEPLPGDSPLWSHPRIWITPHAAGPTNQESAPRQIAADILRLSRGERIPHAVDVARGY